MTSWPELKSDAQATEPPRRPMKKFLYTVCAHGLTSPPCWCLLLFLVHKFFSLETCWHLFLNSSPHLNNFHHSGCDFNTDGEKPPNIIVSLLLNVLDYRNLKLYLTLPFSQITTAFKYSAESHWHVWCIILLRSAENIQRWEILALCSQSVWVLRRKKRSKKLSYTIYLLFIYLLNKS